MSKYSPPKPINETQRRFQSLCDLGGGVKGGPARTRVQKLLRTSGRLLNELAYGEIAAALADNPMANPWHVCFAVGLAWGHLATLHPDFIKASIGCLAAWNDSDLKTARKYSIERGPDVIEDSLRGGNMLFAKVVLPSTIPTTIAGMRKAQDRWLSPILNKKERPRYIGSWNSSALFMIALFANPVLAASYRGSDIGLPPGGPIYQGLSILHKAHVVAKAPAALALDEEQFEPAAIFTNTDLLAELLRGLEDWNTLDVHSGVYLLGTRYEKSDGWLDWSKAID